MMKRLSCFCWFLCCLSIGMAQELTMRGKVLDAKGLAPLAGATLVIKDTVTRHIAAFCTSAGDGTFTLRIPSNEATNHSLLQVSSLGYKQQQLKINTRKEWVIKLQEETFIIDEVTVKADKIIQRKDTTSYFVSSFATQKDRSIGDVLANMPGIHVADNGQISYNGEAVSKFYIEGIDLLDGRYSMATNNLSYNNIAKVEVIENHQAMKTLKNSGLNTVTAINLKLKEGAKAKWNGNLLAKGGFSPALWEGELFAARFSAQSQSLSTLKSNNTGKEIAGESITLTLDDLLYMQVGSDISESLKAVPASSTDLAAERTRFNCTHTFNHSSMWKLSPDSQLKAQFLFTDNRNNYDQFIAMDYYLPDSTLRRTTEEESRLKQRTLQTILSTVVDKTDYYLSDELRYSSNWQTQNAHITGDFTNHSVADITTHHIENRLKFVKRIGRNYLRINSLNRYKSMPEALTIKTQSESKQDIRKSHFFTNTHLNYTFNLNRWALGMNTELFASFLDMKSCLQQTSADTLSINDLALNYGGIRIHPEATYQYNDLSLTFKLPVSLYRFWGIPSTEKVYLCPDLHLKWKFSPRWTLNFNGTLGTTFTGNPQYYTAPILTDYRSLYAGFINLKGKEVQRVGGRISYANPVDMLFANVGVMHSVEHPRRSIAKQVTTNGVLYTYTPGDDFYKLWLVDARISKGINALNGKIELHGSHQQHKMPLVQNTQTTLFDFGTYQADLTLTSNVVNWVDISYQIAYRHNFIHSDAMQSATQNVTQNLRMNLYPTENLTLKFHAEAYHTRFSSGQKKSVFIADAECSYRFKHFDLTASITNLFNQRKYAYTLYGDLSSTQTEYKMRGREILLGISFTK